MNADPDLRTPLSTKEAQRLQARSGSLGAAVEAGPRFEILGTLEAYAGGRRLGLGPTKQRTVLALLLCRANRIVPISDLSDALWDDAPPRTARKNIQVYVSTLRRTLGLDQSRDQGSDQSPDQGSDQEQDPGWDQGRDRAGDQAASGSSSDTGLVHRPPGYLLTVGPAGLDALRFRELARAGRHAAGEGDAAAAARLLGRAVRLWRGPVLPEFATAPGIAAEAQRLRDEYLAAYEDWAEALLALGRHAELLQGLDDLVRRHPLRERLRRAQMLALYRAGRQTEALAGFDAMRQLLARDLGLRPSPVLTRLYESILAGGRGLNGGPALPGAAAPAFGSADRARATPREPVGFGRELADFTGRSREIALLLRMLDGTGPDGPSGSGRPADDGTTDDPGAPGGSGGTAVISGAAGTGKTALAVRCGYRLGARFPDGRILVGLRGADDGPRPVPDVLGDLLRGLGLTGPLPREARDRAAMLRETTAGRRVLFILDDAVTEAQARSVLSMSGDGAVVIVSRRRLSAVECAARLALEPFAEAEALELLGRLIGADRVAAEPEAARRLAAACCGLPLAVRIAGAKLAGLRHLTLARYAERLAGRQRVLDELSAGDLEIRTRLAASYQGLESSERAVLRRLASLAGPGFSAVEAADALGTDLARAEAEVERLIEAHLVETLLPTADFEANLDAEVEAHAAYSGHDWPGGQGGQGGQGGDGARFSLPPLMRAFIRQQHER